MFFLIKFAIWIAGVSVIGYYALGFFGYEINRHYFDAQKAQCEEQLNQCKKDLIKSGIDGAKEKCDWKCVNPKLLIRKQSSQSESETQENASSETKSEGSAILESSDNQNKALSTE